MKRQAVIILFFLIYGFTIDAAFGQDIALKLGSQEIALNQYFTISIIVQNENVKNYSAFPNIEGFTKRGTSSSTSTSYVNGQVTSSHTITQNYQPQTQGTFQLKNFEMTINGKKLSQNGITINVSEPIQQQSQSVFDDPFDRFFGGQRSRTPTEYVDVKADAFLSLSTNKNEVYVGEGFTTTLAFYVSASNRADLRFYDLTTQLTEILKKIKPKKCWEENFNIENVEGMTVNINGKQFTKYPVYQATFFPLSDENIYFPSVGLQLIQYKVAKNPTFFGRNRQEDYKTFYTKAKTVRVKPLPPHPLQDKVSVGQFSLDENLNPKEVETGKSFSYIFNVYGEGHISSITEPDITENRSLDFYEPNTQQKIERVDNQVRGYKLFNYYGIPKEPGTYQLKDFFQYIFFNPIQHRYDTLLPKALLTVTGESKKNNEIMSSDVGFFYDRIALENNQLRERDEIDWVTIGWNVCLVIGIGMSLFLMIKKVTF